MSLTLRSTKGSPLTHDEADANFSGLADGSLLTGLSASSGASLVGFIQSGTNAVATTVQEALRETLSPLQYGGLGNGITNDSAAVLACSVAAVAQGKDVDFAGHIWLLGTQIALTSAHTGLSWRLRGATLKKGFSGDFVTNNGAQKFAVHGVGTIDGQHGTFTGKGFVFSTGNSDSPYFAPGIIFTSFTDSHIEFGADAGEEAKIYSNFFAGSGQATFKAITHTGIDSTAMHRLISGCHAPDGGIFDLSGANNTSVLGGTASIVTDANSQLSRIFGVSTSFGTVFGNQTLVIGCRVSSSTTIDSTASGEWIGNAQTAGTFTNNSVNMFAIQVDTSAGDGQTFIGKQKLFAQPTGQERILTARLASVGDSNITLQVGSNAPYIRFSTTTAPRTVTLSTTGAINGDYFHVANKGASNVDVGGLKTLTGGSNQWCHVVYNGGSWELVAFGSL